MGERVDQGDDGKTDEGKLAEDKRWKHLYNNGGDDDYLEVIRMMFMAMMMKSR